jgi:hypothetical protein
MNENEYAGVTDRIKAMFIVHVQNNTERQAIHDYLVYSVVIIKENNSANMNESQETE